MELFKMIQQLFEQYGYLVMFLGLFLEFIALPFPGETTMAYAGFLSYTGTLRFDILLIVAFLGTTIGMSITYWIGKKAGLPVLLRFGGWFFKESKLLKTQKFFDKYGASLIFFGYFIPGVRHFTGYFAGIMNISFKKFAAYAFSGALFWTLLFLGIGKIFGPQWSVAFQLAERYAIWIVSVIALAVAGFVIFRFRAMTASIWVSFVQRFKKNKRISPSTYSLTKQQLIQRLAQSQPIQLQLRLKQGSILRIQPGRCAQKIVLKKRVKSY